MTKELFKRGGNFPSTQKVSFDNKLGGASLLLHYSNNKMILPGLPHQIAQYEISSCAPKDKDDVNQFSMFVSNNMHNIAVLDSAVVKHSPPKSMFRKTADPTETKLQTKHSSFALAPHVRKKYRELEQ